MERNLARKAKGDLAELKVATDLMARGYQIALPYGEDWDYDLILRRGDELERVQVKYARSDGKVVVLRCRSQSLTGGRVRATKRYTKETIDWLAAYDATTDRCYYVPAEQLREGRSILHVRLEPPRNGQSTGVRLAVDHLAI